MKLLNNPKYHLYSLFGFVLYVICTLSLDKISYQLKYIEHSQLRNAITYFLLEGMACGALAYVLSIPILFYLEKRVDVGNFKKRMALGIFAVFLVCQVIYSLIIWPLLDKMFFYYIGKHTELNIYMKLTNMPYFAAIFVIWLFVVITIMLFNYINQVKLNQLQLESNLRESQLNTLKGQINPHFMFNSLNNIRGLILEDAGRARDMITRLSEMLRYSLTKNDVNTILIKEELQTVDNYIEISKIQFEERLTFNIQVATNVLNLQIPPMIIQMLVENAVKHGIGKIKDGGEVSLIIETEGDHLNIIVQNSGTLTIDETTTRLGLENIKKRLSLIFGERAGFTLVEKTNFVEAKITIPLA
jgi:sensor histidine kinase YesM